MKDRLFFRVVGTRTCIVLAVLLSVSNIVIAEIIPSDRRVTWQGNVGVPGGIPNVTTVYASFPTVPLETDLQNALNSCPSNQVVQLGPWTATFSSDLILSKNGVVLRGSVDANGKPATKIIFSGGGFSIRASSFSETTMNTEVNLAVDANKGDTTINVGTTPSWVIPGQLYIL